MYTFVSFSFFYISIFSFAWFKKINTEKLHENILNKICILTLVIGLMHLHLIIWTLKFSNIIVFHLVSM